MIKQEVLIEVNHVYAGYTPSQSILQNVNLQVFRNDFIGIIGPNGGGKSTLLKVILGLLDPFKGEVVYHLGKSGKNKIGYLPQVNSNDKDFPISVLDVVLSGLMGRNNYWTRYSKEDKETAFGLLKLVKLDQFYNRPIGQLSGGQMQRVYLCRAIINQPEILILDEPNAFVDKTFEGELYNLLKELNSKMAILLVSHDLGTISSVVKTIACVNEELHYHNTNKISAEILKTYNCPIELITHGQIPHRVLYKH
jgi:zinc transport system ATP-binding protein